MLPSVIAHRGASGYLPEHTLEAKALAHAMGVDYLEQDVVATSDGTLVVLHDIFLDHVTDVAQKFPEMRREDGFHYVIDFDIDQIRTLNVFERRHPERDDALYPGRFPRSGPGLKIATLEDELMLIAGLNATTGRSVGIYPEIKDPAWHHRHSIDLAASLLDTLSRFGYSAPEHNIFVQCFDAAELRRLRLELGCRMQLTQLLLESDMKDLEALEQIAQVANGLGLPYTELVVEAEAGSPSGTMTSAPLMQDIRAAGLICHPYTFRRDRLPAFADSLESLLELFYDDVRVDGVFCDHPDIAIAMRDLVSARLQSATTA